MDSEEVLDFDLGDLLVTTEATWVHERRPTLLKIWRALRRICHEVAPEEEFLDEASFGIFGSFVYRWTDTDYMVEETSSQSLDIDNSVTSD